MAARFFFMAAGARPRSPSLPPSSRIRIAGRSRSSVLAMRARPPAVVSPEMLAFATL